MSGRLLPSLLVLLSVLSVLAVVVNQELLDGGPISHGRFVQRVCFFQGGLRGVSHLLCKSILQAYPIIVLAVLHTPLYGCTAKRQLDHVFFRCTRGDARQHASVAKP